MLWDSPSTSPARVQGSRARSATEQAPFPFRIPTSPATDEARRERSRAIRSARPSLYADVTSSKTATRPRSKKRRFAPREISQIRSHTDRRSRAVSGCMISVLWNPASSGTATWVRLWKRRPRRPSPPNVQGQGWGNPILAALECGPDDFTSLGGTLDRFNAAGLELVEMVVADGDSWDRHVAAQWWTIDQWVGSHRGDTSRRDARSAGRLAKGAPRARSPLPRLGCLRPSLNSRCGDRRRRLDAGPPARHAEGRSCGPALARPRGSSCEWVDGYRHG